VSVRKNKLTESMHLHLIAASVAAMNRRLGIERAKAKAMGHGNRPFVGFLKEYLVEEIDDGTCFPYTKRVYRDEPLGDNPEDAIIDAIDAAYAPEVSPKVEDGTENIETGLDAVDWDELNDLVEMAIAELNATANAENKTASPLPDVTSGNVDDRDENSPKLLSSRRAALTDPKGCRLWDIRHYPYRSWKARRGNQAKF